MTVVLSDSARVTSEALKSQDKKMLNTFLGKLNNQSFIQKYGHKLPGMRNTYMIPISKQFSAFAKVSIKKNEVAIIDIVNRSSLKQFKQSSVQ